jgi:hypothetical protein
MKPGYRLALTGSAALVLLAYKAIAIAPLAPLPIVLGWALEGATLWLLWALCESAQRLPRPLRIAANGLFYFGLYVLVVTSLLHTYFYESAAERRFSLLELDLRTLGFFFTSVLPPRGYATVAALLAAMHVLAYFMRRLLCPLRPMRVAVWLLASWFVLGLLLVTRPRVPSPLADMGASVWERLTIEEVAIDRQQPARYTPRVLDKSASPALPPELPFKKVLVFVMETMTTEVVERERRMLPATTFVNGARGSTREYTRYYATNQDSRTGMLSMLGSRFIPYEAYTEEGRDGYLFLGHKSSLVDLFAQRGYRTAFAVSQVEIELVVGDLPWHEKLNLSKSEVQELGKQHLCFVPYEFEHSCEDRALLPKVLSYLDRNERAFLYQEFIWGHSSLYNEASGKTNTEYYSAYLDAIVSHLRQRGTLDETLIVLTADHGFRDKGLQTERSVYQLPLWFFAPRFQAARDDRLLSHLDFKDLLLHELAPESPTPAENPFVMIVGPTGTSFITVLTRSGQFMLLKRRNDEHYLLRAEGAGGAAEASPADFLRLFEDYLTYFAAQRG